MNAKHIFPYTIGALSVLPFASKAQNLCRQAEAQNILFAVLPEAKIDTTRMNELHGVRATQIINGEDISVSMHYKDNGDDIFDANTDTLKFVTLIIENKIGDAFVSFRLMGDVYVGLGNRLAGGKLTQFDIGALEYGQRGIADPVKAVKIAVNAFGRVH